MISKIIAIVITAAAVITATATVSVPVSVPTIAAVAAVAIPDDCAAVPQDSPVLRQMLSDALRQTLAEHHSRDTAWRIAAVGAIASTFTVIVLAASAFPAASTLQKATSWTPSALSVNDVPQTAAPAPTQ